MREAIPAGMVEGMVTVFAPVIQVSDVLPRRVWKKEDIPAALNRWSRGIQEREMRKERQRRPRKSRAKLHIHSIKT